MGPKAKVFQAPDGKEFDNRREYRDYMMSTYYSWKNCKDRHDLIRAAGDIDGQSYEIEDSSNCTMVIMDITDQITIDHLENCKVFIGACSNSVFIRNCSNCTFYTCCRQLRLRDVTETKFYVYSQAEVHIEFSSKVRFAPFNGGYPEQEAHFVEARLNVEENLWYDIFDHNDADKTGENWSLMDPSEYGQPWFPGETCTPFVPVTLAGSVAKEDKDQVGESFGADQMRADSAGMYLCSYTIMPHLCLSFHIKINH